VAPWVALSARAELDRFEEPALAAALEAAHRLHLTLRAPLSATALARIGPLLARAAALERAVLVEVDATGELEPALELAAAVARLEPAERVLLLAVAPARARSPLHATRRLALRLAAEGCDAPIVLLDRPAERGADPLLGPAAALGGLLADGIGDAIQIGLPPSEARGVAFGILQAARVRITRTDFISCPSCGRTLFDLEETTARIKARTAHLKGLKIAVMGCIVNGPGEMADADFGYVGWGEDKIALFVGKEMVAKDVPTAEADERLVELIKRHGRWVEPPVPV
jgi:4-hydroxy-3-methylbut-2-en-1-yl diphosphate synthase IspG/GcpE